MAPESARLSLADIIEIADDLQRMSLRAACDGQQVLNEVLERMDELANGRDPNSSDTYRQARHSLETEWQAATHTLQDCFNECNRTLQAFATEADFLIRRFENQINSDAARHKLDAQRHSRGVEL